MRHLTVRYIPQQNGVAEKMNRTLLGRALCMLSNAGLLKCFWTEAVNTTCHLINRSPSITIDFKTLGMIWYSCIYSHLRVFCCPAYFHVMVSLNPRKRKLYFLVMLLGWMDTGCDVLILSHLLLVGYYFWWKFHISTEKGVCYWCNRFGEEASKQVEFWEQNEGVQESTHVEPNDVAQIQLWVMIHLQRNNTLLPQGARR